MRADDIGKVIIAKIYLIIRNNCDSYSSHVFARLGKYCTHMYHNILPKSMNDVM